MKLFLLELSGLVISLYFLKNMCWGNEDLCYIWLIKWIVVLYG